MFKAPTQPIASVLALVIFSVAAPAEESSALVDALVKKGVLSTQEAEEIRADMAKEEKSSSANKIKLSDSINELKLYGDLRLRYQYDSKDVQAYPPDLAPGERVGRSPAANQRSRWRFRLRLNADFKLAENIFGGVELQTALNSDSANQTFQDGFNDYPIFISRAYLGWTPSDWLTVTAGKVPNPLYTTDMFWDADINPTGLTEVIAFHKLNLGESEGSTGGGYSKDGKSVAAEAEHERAWELSLVAGQFIFDDNLEGGGSDISGATRDNDATTDAYLFQTQLVGSYKFSGGVKATVAPGWFTYINGSLGGLDNENSFQDSGLVSGATRNLNILLLPGDVSFKLGGLKAKFYWDFAYNIEGRKRTEDIYRLVSLRAPDAEGRQEVDKHHSSRDDYAYLVGLQLGENKKKGDWSLLANWRQTGIGSVDPNLNDSDFALGELNTRGVKLGAAYNFTDFCVGAITYMYAQNLRSDLEGGEATGGNAIADSNNIQVLQVDLNVKF